MVEHIITQNWSARTNQSSMASIPSSYQSNLIWKWSSTHPTYTVIKVSDTDTNHVSQVEQMESRLFSVWQWQWPRLEGIALAIAMLNVDGKKVSSTRVTLDGVRPPRVQRSIKPDKHLDHDVITLLIELLLIRWCNDEAGNVVAIPNVISFRRSSGIDIYVVTRESKPAWERL